MQKKKTVMINLLALWMALSALPAILQLGLEQRNLIISILEWTCYVGLILGALGLMLLTRWGWNLAIKALILEFLWVLYLVIFVFGPQFSQISAQFSQSYQITEEIIGKGIILLIVLYLITPIFGILYLTHPSIKQKFHI